MYININNNKSVYNQVKVYFLQSVISNIIITWKWDISIFYIVLYLQIYIISTSTYIQYKHSTLNSTIHLHHSSWQIVSTSPTRSSPDPQTLERLDSPLKIITWKWESWRGRSPTRVMLGTSFIHSFRSSRLVH